MDETSSYGKIIPGNLPRKNYSYVTDGFIDSIELEVDSSDKTADDGWHGQGDDHPAKRLEGEPVV